MKTEPSPPLQLPEFAHELARSLAGVRERQRMVARATAGAVALTVVLAWLAGESLLDFLLALPRWVRALGLVASLGGAGWAVWRGLRRSRSQPDDDAVALMVERAQPEFRSRLISAVQLARGSATPIVRALVAETAALTRTLRPAAAIDTKGMRRAWSVAAVFVLICLGLWFGGGENSAPLLRRAFLSNEPAPRRTKLHMLSGGGLLAVGSDFTVEAGVSGVVPPAGRLHVKPATGREQDLPLETDPAHRTSFARTLPSVSESFDYFVLLGDARSETFHVQVQPGPAIADIEGTQIFPAYTQLPPRPVKLTGLSLLAGSRLALRVKADTPVQSGTIQVVAGALVLSETPLAPATNDPALLTGEVAIPARDATGFALRLVGAGGIAARAATVYPFAIIASQPPAVKILQPARAEELLTSNATMPLAFVAKSEFGIAKIRLHYAVDWTEGASSQTVDLEAGNGSVREIARGYEWKLARLQPPVSEGQVVDFWIEALAANEAPGGGAMEHYHARIVSEFEKRAELAGHLGKVAAGLVEVQRGQEETEAQLGAMVAQPAPTPDSLRESEAKMQSFANEIRQQAGQVEAILGEYERNRLAGEDVDGVAKMRDTLNRLAGDMQAAADFLKKARAATEPGAARKAVSDAQGAQKPVLAQLKQLLAEHGRQQEGIDFAHALAQLAERQTTGLQKAVTAGRQQSTRRMDGFGKPVSRNFDGQMSEQMALAAELKSVAENIVRFVREPGHAEMAQRLQPAAADAPRALAAAEAAGAMLKEGQIFKAAVEEKTARDILRRLAKQIAPPQSPAEISRDAEQELGKMMAAQTAIATGVEQGGVQDFEAWLDRQAADPGADKKFQRPRDQLRADKALRDEFQQVQRDSQENLATLERREGDLVLRGDLLVQDLTAPAPAAAQIIRGALEKMQDMRALLLDKSTADAATKAQAALADLEKARGEVAPHAIRTGPSAPPAAPNASAPAQQLAAAEKQAGDLAKIIQAEQKLELETAKIIATASRGMNAMFKGLDVRQADLRAQTGDVKTALSGNPTDGVEALNDAGRDMGVAKSELEKPDGFAADAAERKALAGLYRAVQALNRQIALTREQLGGKEAAEAGAVAQMTTQLTHAQETLAEAQQDFQKVEAARQAGQANARIMQEATAALTQAAQQAGQAVAEGRTTNEAALRMIQEAAQEASDGAAQAAAGHADEAKAKTGSTQTKLAQAIVTLSFARVGLAPAAAPSTPEDSPPPANHEPGGAHPDLTGLPARDRAAIEQSQSDKVPAEYGAMIEQYLRNLATGSAPK